MVIMKVEVLTITPEMAKRCLEKNNIENRNLSPSRVQAIAEDIKNGKWILTHQGIAFDNDGNLLDGQHRLAACIKANIPIKVFVTKGMTKESCVAVDNVRPRSVNDHARQLGMDISTSHSAIAQILEYGAGAQDHISMDRKLELITKYQEGIGFAVKVCRSATKFQSPSKAVIARAFYTQDHAKLARFMDVYISMVTENKSESAAVILHKYLLGSRLYGWTIREEMYRKTESALDYFLRGVSITKLYGTENELFELPVLM